MRERVQMCLREHEEVRAVSPCCRGIGVHWTFGFVQRPRFSATAPQYGSEAVGQWAGAGGLSVTTKTATRRRVGEKWIGLLSLRGRCWNWAGKSLLEEKTVSKKKFFLCINAMSVLQHIYIIHCLKLWVKGSCLYQLMFEMFLSIMVSKTRKLCLIPPNRSWDCLLKERETFWERVEWLERETTADGGAPTLTKYCKSPAVKPAAEGTAA